MRRLLLLPILILAACNSPAGANSEQAEASGSGDQRSYTVGSFDAVELGGRHNVVVAVGGAPSVRAEGPSEVLDKLDIRVEHNVLKINEQRGWSEWSHHRKAATVYVTVPALSGAAIGGSGDMQIDRVKGDDFDAAIGGSGNMSIGQLAVGSASFSVAGSGNMKAAGSAKSVKISVAGSGDVDAGALETQTASVSIAGSGDASIHASESASASVIGSGNITVAGGAHCKSSKMGSGEIRCT